MVVFDVYKVTENMFRFWSAVSIDLFLKLIIFLVYLNRNPAVGRQMKVLCVHI